MFQLFLLKQWKNILGVILVCSLAYGGYHSIYKIGYKDASDKYAKIIQKYNDDTADRINRLTADSSDILSQIKLNNTNAKQDLQKILKANSGKPTYIIEQGKCELSPDFIKGYNAAVTRVNK